MMKTTRFVLVIVFSFLLILGIVWERTQLVRSGYELDRKERRKQALIEQNELLKLQLSRLRSPQYVERIARTQLGLTNIPSWQDVHTVAVTPESMSNEPEESRVLFASRFPRLRYFLLQCFSFDLQPRAGKEYAKSN